MLFDVRPLFGILGYVNVQHFLQSKLRVNEEWNEAF